MAVKCDAWFLIFFLDLQKQKQNTNKYSLLGNMVETSGNRLYKNDYIKVKFLGYDNVV